MIKRSTLICAVNHDGQVEGQAIVDLEINRFGGRQDGQSYDAKFDGKKYPSPAIRPAPNRTTRYTADKQP